MVSREKIEECIKAINEAENSFPHHTIEETIAAIDSICASDFEGSNNRSPFHNIETERKAEKWLLRMIPDYHRTIEKKIIDPPYASIEWTMRGTIDDKGVEIYGCSILECNEDGLLKRGTVYFDTSQLPPMPS